MPTLTLEDTDVRAFVRVLAQLFGVHLPDGAALATSLQAITHQLGDIKMAIEDARTKAEADSAKVDNLLTEVHGLRDRIAAADSAKDAALAAANSAKDAATTALQAAQDEVASLKAAAQAVPADTSALEAALDSLGSKLDAAKDEVAAIDAAPAAPATGEVSGSDTTSSDPSAPQGGELPSEPSA
jgi:peptidoglycan hydrolase CwlO-like protein